MGWRQFAGRAYGGAADLQAMIGLLIRARPPQRIAEFPGIVDLHELLAQAQVRSHTRLWEDTNGELAGFAIAYLEYDRLLFELAPRAEAGELAGEMVSWGETCVRRAGREEGLPVTLTASCRHDHAERIALLEQHGFARQPVPTLHMVRLLSEPIPEPQLPAGFTIRPVAGEGEVDALVALHRAAFITNHLTAEDRLGWMRTPEYDPELDLVAVAPDGALAAYLFCSISRRQNALSGRKEGYTDPAGTHPAFRRRGLVRALFLEGLHRLKGRGMETAAFSTWGENTALQEMARSLGYRVESMTIFFEKRLSGL